MLNDTTTVSESHFPDSVSVVHFEADVFDVGAEILMEEKNNVGVVPGLPDQCEIIHGLMRDQTRGTCV